MQSANADLAGLTLTSGTLSPAFASGTLSYAASVNNTISSVTITPTRADTTSTVTVNGVSPTTPVALVFGPNVITVLVTAQDGVTVKNYTVTVTRVPSSNANLSYLVLSSGTLSPAFASGTLSYAANVFSDTAHVIITPSLADATASVSVNGLSPVTPVSLRVGHNNVNIEVTAQDTLTIRNYTVTVIRATPSIAGEPDLVFDPGSVVNGQVFSLAPADNGKFYIAGSFTSVRGALRNRIARLNADGTVDTSFDPGTGAAWTVNSIAVQSDGKVLIGGDFTAYNSITRNYIARLNTDGSLDASFNPGSGANGIVNSVALQTDGKVIIGGDFLHYNGTARNRIARLNTDGSLDTGYDPGSGVDNLVRSIALQGDGKAIIGGDFTNFGGVARSRVARVNVNGSLDTSFTPGTGASNSFGATQIRSVVVQSDGKVFIGGDFTSYNGTGRNRIARLNANGSLDSSFNPSHGPNTTVASIAMQSDGKVLIGGFFTNYNGTEHKRLTRLNSDGTVDTSFNPGTGPNNWVFSVMVLSDGKLLIGGGFSTFNGMPRNCVALLDANGALDTSLNPGTGASESVYCFAEQANGKILIGGDFARFGNTAHRGIARINADGSLDSSFDVGSGASASVNYIALLPDEKVLIGGSFTHFNGTARNCIARINSDGSLDSGFNPGAGISASNANPGISSLLLQENGKVLIVGNFTSYNGTARNYIARLNEDGSLDTSFNPASGANSSIGMIAPRADGKILICGNFTTFDGTSRNYIARLNTDGSLDTSFDPGSGANSAIFSITLQADGKIIIGGNFTSYNGTARNRIARLNENGSLDMSFNLGTGPNNAITSVALQTDGKLIIGGFFTNYNGTARRRIARLNEDGSLDTDSYNGSSANATVRSVTLQADGKVLIGGDFVGYNGVARSYLARILNSPASQTLTASSPSRIEWLRGGSAPEVGQVSFESSPDGEAWTALGSGTRVSGGWELTGLSLPDSGQLRARGRSSSGSSSLIEQVVSYSLLATPTVTTAAISGITPTAASGGGEVTADGGASVTERGLVYAITPDPTLATGTGVIAGSGIGIFTANLSSLVPGTTYYVRAFATNSAGSGYSSSVSFTTTLASSNAKLTGLGWSPLSPLFDSDILNYESTIPSGSNVIEPWVITPVAEDPNATITINGQPASAPLSLSNPVNTLSILVTAQDGITTRNYNFVLRRPVTYLVPGTNISLGYIIINNTARIVECNSDSIGSLIIPAQLGGQNVTSINDSVFSSIAGLTSITLPDSVVSVGALAFSGSGITTINIGEGLATIGVGAFSGCTNLTSFSVDPENQHFASSGGVLLNKSMTALIEFPRGLTGAYVVPEGVSIIRENAFASCGGLTSVTLPSSLVTIESSAFSSCSGIVSISIPSSVTTIGANAFFACSGLAQVTIGSGVTFIGGGAFGFCGSLAGAIFMGNAPTLENNIAFFANAAGFTIYYQAGATGFTTPTWNGYPAQPISTSPPVTIADANLEAALRTALSKPTGPITEADMLTLTNLRLNNLGIANLSGLEKATNLRILDIRRNAFASAAALWAILDQITPMYCLYVDVRRPGNDPAGLITQTLTDTSGNSFFILVDAPNLPILNFNSLNVDTNSTANLVALQVISDAGVQVDTGGVNLPPVARASFTINNAAIGAVVLNGSASSDIDGTIAAWAWSWSGGSASGVNPTVTLPAGETAVILTVTDDDGATANTSLTVSIVTLASAIQASGLSGENALPNATPFNDGVENLLKYAFNMNLAGPDARTLPPGTGTSGLPVITTPEGAPAGTLRFEFLRRKGSGLVYAPRKSTTLDGASWSPLAAAPAVTAINEQWERVVYTEAPDPVPAPACFGRVEVTAP